ncbi:MULTISPECIES: endolytic transglycosylase MltG [Sinorhizobium]|uniref:Endolytic murein transglycosylase n=1 Tax=Rhizobium meliloti TaxID=382 RepID=A0A2J0Z2T2_RHIML|nr:MULTISPECIES: endolytic transglycosylase MltG [Sinorhizobium]GCA49079.1 putative aminodeoxychorismate lyase [Sinorhizobium sp. KGO-5]PJR14827.1 4-amino-4-deoxychorismate lyase [Sinorhizobium meliloti]WEJ11064.1 endolytic transglycosylase MltG [Sinorhizobium sp. M103]WEJ14342.1 endolytic transglycosylase MltG [Sinorhizobium sp. K101]WEJ38049.1 endolytic transglycosylase MltG [Sinorhizobium sp. C101]
MSDSNDNSAVQFGRNETGSNGPIIPKSANEALRPERVPHPPKRSRKARSQVVIFLNFVMTVVVFVALAAAGAVYYAMHEYEKPGPLEANKNFIVRSGAGISEIASNLERNEIITDSRVFRFVSEAYLSNDTLKAGEYEIKAHASMQEIMELLKSGKSILYSVSLPEGLTVKQMFHRLADDPVLVGDLPAELPPEGSLKPDTYKFTRGTDRNEIIKQMTAAQEALVQQIWEKRDPDLPVSTIEEFVTLASIVEKETGRADERPRVASVFINRLEKGMRLQSDPTIIYGIFGGEGKPADRAILRSDLDKQTPYNTYLIKGLPPTPIANPGRAALEAVANPSRTPELYFVADGTGGHVFAETLDEHNANVRRWRKIEAERAAEAAKAIEAAQDAVTQTGTQQ